MCSHRGTRGRKTIQKCSSYKQIGKFVCRMANLHGGGEKKMLAVIDICSIISCSDCRLSFEDLFGEVTEMCFNCVCVYDIYVIHRETTPIYMYYIMTHKLKFSNVEYHLVNILALHNTGPSFLHCAPLFIQDTLMHPTQSQFPSSLL